MNEQIAGLIIGGIVVVVLSVATNLWIIRTDRTERRKKRIHDAVIVELKRGLGRNAR